MDADVVDVLIAHDNTEAIKSAQAEIASSKDTAGLDD